MSKNKRWSDSEKVRIIIEYLNTDTNAAEICRKYVIAPTTLQSWKSKFVEGGKAALVTRGGSKSSEARYRKQIEALTMKIGELTIANDLLKKTLEVGKR